MKSDKFILVIGIIVFISLGIGAYLIANNTISADPSGSAESESVGNPAQAALEESAELAETIEDAVNYTWQPIEGNKEVSAYVLEEPGYGGYVGNYGYYYKDNYWWRANYNIQIRKFEGNGEIDNTLGTDKSAGITELITRIKNKPDGRAWVVAGGHVFENTKIKGPDPKVRVDQYGNVEVWSNAGTPFPVNQGEIDTGYGFWNLHGGTWGNYTSMFFGDAKTLPKYIKHFYNWAIAVGILIAIIMIIVGGYAYATSAGDIEKINQAKERIIGAVLGLLILLLTTLIYQSIKTEVTIDGITTPTSSPTPTTSPTPVSNQKTINISENIDIETSETEICISDMQYTTSNSFFRKALAIENECCTMDNTETVFTPQEIEKAQANNQTLKKRITIKTKLSEEKGNQLLNLLTNVVKKTKQQFLNSGIKIENLHKLHFVVPNTNQIICTFQEIDKKTLTSQDLIKRFSKYYNYSRKNIYVSIKAEKNWKGGFRLLLDKTGNTTYLRGIISASGKISPNGKAFVMIKAGGDHFSTGFAMQWKIGTDNEQKPVIVESPAEQIKRVQRQIAIFSKQRIALENQENQFVSVVTNVELKLKNILQIDPNMVVIK